MNTVFFIGQYVSPSLQNKFDISPSCKSYSGYIIDSLKSEGFIVKILSVASSQIHDSHYSSIKEDNQERCINFFSIAENNKRHRFLLNQLLIYIQLFVYLIFKTCKNDKILIYHYKGPTKLISYLRRFLKRNYYFLIGEIFSVVFGDNNPNKVKKEIESLDNAQGYILSNDYMKDEIGRMINNKVVCYGPYRLSNYDVAGINNPINIVYAGIISSTKVTDAFLAVETARYLTKDYRLYILGYGSAADIELLQSKIEEINREKGFGIASYEGLLSGKEYLEFLSKCKYGLCTRVLSNDISKYCFPSKVLVYLSCDLIPVVPKLESIANSKVSDAILFVNGDLTPQNVADTIIHTNKERVGKITIESLDKAFRNDLKKIFE